MGREVRRVPPGWVHPHEDRYGQQRYKPLYEGHKYCEHVKPFLHLEDAVALQEALNENGPPPDVDDYMPTWTPEVATHYMMYEDTSEGTPISPAFATPEELARWLTDTSASAMGDMTASYERWLRVCQGGWAPSLVRDAKGLRSGVEL